MHQDRIRQSLHEVLELRVFSGQRSVGNRICGFVWAADFKLASAMFVQQL